MRRRLVLSAWVHCSFEVVAFKSGCWGTADAVLGGSDRELRRSESGSGRAVRSRPISTSSRCSTESAAALTKSPACMASKMRQCPSWDCAA
ncbi:hypothetical protein RHECNPAF_2330062 [Rhizobium etli CNPAF512]|nr:hypothetical protein RHECNPAF_2330062 [Rhizobium etli CNPAF512]